MKPVCKSARKIIRASERWLISAPALLAVLSSGAGAILVQADAAKPPPPIVVAILPGDKKVSDDLLQSMVEMKDALRSNARLEVLTYNPDAPSFVIAARSANLDLKRLSTDEQRQSLAQALGANIWVKISADKANDADIVFSVYNASSGLAIDERNDTNGAAIEIQQAATQVLSDALDASVPAITVAPTPQSEPAQQPTPKPDPVQTPLPAPAVVVPAPLPPPAVAPTSPSNPPPLPVAPAPVPSTALTPTQQTPLIVAPQPAPVPAPQPMPAVAPSLPTPMAPAPVPASLPVTVTPLALPTLPHMIAHEATAPSPTPVAPPAAAPIPSPEVIPVPTLAPVPASQPPVPAPATIVPPPPTAPATDPDATPVVPKQPTPLDDATQSLLNQGDAAMARSDNAAAVEDYRNAVDESPLNAAPRVRLAQAYIAAGNSDAALSELQRAVAIDPNSAELATYLQQAQSQHLLPGIDVLLLTVNAAEKPADQQSQLALGDAYWNSKNLVLAEKTYLQAAHDAPDTSQASVPYSRLARLYAATQRYVECLKSLSLSGSLGYSSALRIIRQQSDTLMGSIDSSLQQFSSGGISRTQLYDQLRSLDSQVSAFASFLGKITPPSEYKMSYLHRKLAANLMAQMTPNLLNYALTAQSSYLTQSQLLEHDALAELSQANAIDHAPDSGTRT